MKATGIVRRIDDLGRVVIPKEIRRTLRIKEGTPLGSVKYRNMAGFRHCTPETPQIMMFFLCITR